MMRLIIIVLLEHFFQVFSSVCFVETLGMDMQRQLNKKDAELFFSVKVFSTTITSASLDGAYFALMT